MFAEVLATPLSFAYSDVSLFLMIKGEPVLPVSFIKWYLVFARLGFVQVFRDLVFAMNMAFPPKRCKEHFVTKVLYILHWKFHCRANLRIFDLIAKILPDESLQLYFRGGIFSIFKRLKVKRAKFFLGHNLIHWQSIETKDRLHRLTRFIPVLRVYRNGSTGQQNKRLVFI